ncbi:hypothetical protein GKZ68_18630 [Hymenobacter sp. BRD128]|uniref:hypothetical protein n=1 Tax=Hymenobacter sp. BRD128 TaxID=2675878 RepID=UPI0015643BF1|nr:hypothetical protein [Hymenobacter sp. BRD128]QKG58469.1 hypothetical protein GKZ68_18630 [Hymenobacter sp. BRD128]
MNEPAKLPTDDTRDPLLAALRERLGDYGAPPPPGAWAGIQQRLPASVRPWWRRPRRLLPALALLLFVLALTGYLLNRPGGRADKIAAHSAHQPVAAPARPAYATRVAGEKIIPTPNGSASKQSVAAVTRSTLASRAAPALTQLPTASELPAPAGLPTATTAAPRADAATVNASPHSAQATRPRGIRLGLYKHLLPSDSAAALAASVSNVNRRAARRLAASASGGQRRRSTTAGLAEVIRRSAFETNGEKAAGGLITPLTRTASAPTNIRTQARRHQLARATRHRPRQQRPLIISEAAQSAEPLLAGSDAPRPAPRRTGQLATLAATTSQAYASQALRRASLAPLTAANLPASLTALPDSSPLARPGRRWALLATAGPTLSYRTIGALPPGLGTRPDFAHLERPAVGLGAQVQVRRVLSGRWALAVGLGYQEYATRLALQQVDSGRTTRIRLRDTYRLLTLPMQLSYALSAPRGRLAKALLLGAEVGWYRGGRSTEGSDCHCQQQAYTATATDSLYSAKTLALSLGLDLRYRIGGADSRWQWLVQPTARYVLTPFVKPNKAGFSPRQPFSLGLYTGFSWDIR